MKIQEFEILRLKEIEFQGNGELWIEQGDKNFFSLEADEETFPHLKVEVERGVLSIKYIEHFTSDPALKTFKCKVTVKDLNSLILKGTSKGTIHNLKTKNFSVHLSGQNRLEAAIQADLLVMKSEGDNYLQFEGKASRQKIELSGKGEYNAESLQTIDCDLRILGNFLVKVHSTEELSVYMIGNSKLYYLGSPKIVEKKVSGKSVIVPLNSDLRVKELE
ncbi:MAG: head GIN domain-containing protein [Simkaniaceae bacterium]